MLGSVEAHVLEEVGEAVLVGSLLDCTDIGGKIKLGTSFREFVVTDVVSESVVKLAHLYGRVARERTQHGIVLC